MNESPTSTFLRTTHSASAESPQDILTLLPGWGHFLFPLVAAAQQGGALCFTEALQEGRKTFRVELRNCRFLPRQVRSGEHLFVASGVVRHTGKE